MVGERGHALASLEDSNHARWARQPVAAIGGLFALDFRLARLPVLAPGTTVGRDGERNLPRVLGDP